MGVDLSEKTKHLPEQPGVYLFKDRAGAIVYVGKAVNLRARVRSYFTRSADRRAVTRFVDTAVADVDYIVTDSEKEAIILEDALIKEHRPKYNIDLKDDKSFLAVRVDWDEEFPRLEVVRVRRTRKEKDEYIGPFASAANARETARLLSKIFLIRRCTNAMFRNRTRPCLDWQIKICPGPCCGLIAREEYRAGVERAVMILKGRDREVIRQLQANMREASERMRYEEAGRYRDQIKAIESTIERQKVVSPRRIDRDVFGIQMSETEIAVQALAVRGGILTGGKEFFFTNHGLEPAEVMASFLIRFYSISDLVPREVLLPVAIEGQGALSEWLAERRGAAIELLVPRRGDNLRLVEMANKNARLRLLERARRKEKGTAVLDALAKRLTLSGPPVRIECYDVSHVGGTDCVGSVVTFVNGEPDKSGYRRYKIRCAAPGDDYGAMYEVMRRRWKRLLQARKGAAHADRPDLVLIDGGKGQLNVALAVLHDLGVEDVEVAAISKGGDHTVSKTVETDRLFRPGRRNPIRFPAGSRELFLLQRIRDESHRFAIAYQRRLRNRSVGESILDGIRGIGKTRRMALLKRFGSAGAVADASIGEIAAACGINEGLAASVLEEVLRRTQR